MSDFLRNNSKRYLENEQYLEKGQINDHMQQQDVYFMLHLVIVHYFF